MRYLVMITVGIQIILGNVCLMNVAYAAGDEGSARHCHHEVQNTSAAAKVQGGCTGDCYALQQMPDEQTTSQAQWSEPASAFAQAQIVQALLVIGAPLSPSVHRPPIQDTSQMQLAMTVMLR